MNRLHLGCGTRYLDGYTNIDHPPTEHTVQVHLVADLYKDITKLQYQNASIDEIRLHHVFEHFPRQIALALLCRWSEWLKPGGILRIETPDVMKCASALVSPFSSMSIRQQVIRHLFGSHEASWAAHWDGWYRERFKNTLSILGFKDLKFIQSNWGALYNIEVFAVRDKRTFDLTDYENIVEQLLHTSLIKHKSLKSMDGLSGSEVDMLKIWMSEWKSKYLEKYE
jgi:hypothetical protein